MELINQNVIHPLYGTGIVIAFDGKNITVQFANHEVKKFVYPTAFEKFIQAEDSIIQEGIMREIIQAQQLKEEKQQQKPAPVNKQKQTPSQGQLITPAKKHPQKIEEGFDDAYHVQHMVKSPVLTYKEVEEQFQIKIAGFGRGINPTPSSVVLISSIAKKKSGYQYHDKWTEDGDYLYSGEGKNGDQTMSRGNRAIATAADEGKTLHLFIKFSPQEYYYQGIFKLLDYTYEDEKAEDGSVRKEYKFRLRKAAATAKDIGGNEFD